VICRDRSKWRQQNLPQCHFLHHKSNEKYLRNEQIVSWQKRWQVRRKTKLRSSNQTIFYLQCACDSLSQPSTWKVQPLQRPTPLLRKSHDTGSSVRAVSVHFPVGTTDLHVPQNVPTGPVAHLTSHSIGAKGRCHRGQSSPAWSYRPLLASSEIRVRGAILPSCHTPSSLAKWHL